MPAAGAGEVFLVFLKLGLTSFGGPVAHLGYFREEFVTRRRWLDERAYADLVALCQFLPGPASSQVGLAIGLVARGLSRRARRLDRLHPAVGLRAGGVRPRRRRDWRRRWERMAARSQGRRRGRRRASGARHDALARTRQGTGNAGGCGCGDRARLPFRLGTGRCDRTRRSCRHHAVAHRSTLRSRLPAAGR